MKGKSGTIAVVIRWCHFHIMCIALTKSNTVFISFCLLMESMYCTKKIDSTTFTAEIFNGTEEFDSKFEHTMND